MVTIFTASLTFKNSTSCPHSVFMCFVWIWEQSAIISLYNSNWLVFITEIKPFTAQWLLYVPSSLTFNNSTFCPHSVFVCFVWIWEQTAIIPLYSINWLVSVTETECVYCALRTGSLTVNHMTITHSLMSHNAKCLLLHCAVSTAHYLSIWGFHAGMYDELSVLTLPTVLSELSVLTVLSVRLVLSCSWWFLSIVSDYLHIFIVSVFKVLPLWPTFILLQWRDSDPILSLYLEVNLSNLLPLCFCFVYS